MELESNWCQRAVCEDALAAHSCVDPRSHTYWVEDAPARGGERPSGRLVCEVARASLYVFMRLYAPHLSQLLPSRPSCDVGEHGVRFDVAASSMLLIGVTTHICLYCFSVEG
jgi:hypothetical protein